MSEWIASAVSFNLPRFQLKPFDDTLVGGCGEGLSLYPGPFPGLNLFRFHYLRDVVNLVHHGPPKSSRSSTSHLHSPVPFLPLSSLLFAFHARAFADSFSLVASRYKLFSSFCLETKLSTTRQLAISGSLALSFTTNHVCQAVKLSQPKDYRLLLPITSSRHSSRFTHSWYIDPSTSTISACAANTTTNAHRVTKPTSLSSNLQPLTLSPILFCAE